MANVRIEVLFPEYCNLFGDSANVRYLQKTLPDAEFIFTKLDEEPKFLTEEMSLVYMGPMTENTQELVINKLKPYKNKLKEKIDSGLAFLFTGNALEVLGEYIDDGNGKKIEAVGLYPYHAKRDMFHRHNSEELVTFGDMQIMGFKTQFTQCYPNEENFPWLFEIKKGMGMNLDTKGEGWKDHNFMGTYLVGPILPNNPNFCKYLLNLIGAKDAEPAFLSAAQAAYDKRLKDFMDKVADKPAKYHYM
jgi:lipid II isoglutaminyl synthase (glutamine-hydrolysing)